MLHWVVPLFNVVVVLDWVVSLFAVAVVLDWDVLLFDGEVVLRFNGTIISSAVVPCFILTDLYKAAMRSTRVRFTGERATDVFRCGSLYCTGMLVDNNISGSESL